MQQTNTYVIDRLIANIDSDREERCSWDPSSVGSEVEVMLQGMLTEVKWMGMELERQRPQEWNQFLNACLFGSSSTTVSSVANSVRGSLAAT